MKSRDKHNGCTSTLIVGVRFDFEGGIGNEKIHITYEHNPTGDTLSRITHVIPGAVLTAMPSRDNTNEKLYNGMAFKATVCGVLPQEIMFIY